MLTLYKIILNILLRMPNWFFAAIFIVAFPIYKALHQKRAYGRTIKHLQNASAYLNTLKAPQAEAFAKCTAKEVFRGIYWNAIDSYRGLGNLPQIQKRTIFENENVILDAMASCTSRDGTPLPIAAISIHQGPFELLHRSLCRFSDNVHLITDSVGDETTRWLLKDLRSHKSLTEYYPHELPQLLRNLFTPPSQTGKKKNAILAMVIDQGRHTKGNIVSLFGQHSTLYSRLPEKVNQMGAGIVTFRAFTRPVQTSPILSHKTEIVIRFEKYYPPKFSQQNSLESSRGKQHLTDCIAKEVESWISEHPSEWSWNYHGNFHI